MKLGLQIMWEECDEGKHVWMTIETGEKCCQKCFIIDTGFMPCVSTDPYNSYLWRPQLNYSREKYFIKTLEKYISKPGVHINHLERGVLERDFEIKFWRKSSGESSEKKKVHKCMVQVVQALTTFRFGG